jgi:hypothetical protein
MRSQKATGWPTTGTRLRGSTRRPTYIYIGCRIHQGSNVLRESPLMEPRIAKIRVTVTEVQSKSGRARDAASDNFNDWTDSSMDLRLGLDVIELSAEMSWADLQKVLGILPPRS